MLLEDPNGCCICGTAVRGFVGIVPVYFCPNCFETYEADILAKVPWCQMLINIEKQRRKRRNRLISGIGLPLTTNLYQGVTL